MVSRRCKRRLVSGLSVGGLALGVGVGVGWGGGGGGGGGVDAHAPRPARSAMCAATCGGTTAPLDVQNTAADVWSCTVRTRSTRAPRVCHQAGCPEYRLLSLIIAIVDLVGTCEVPYRQ